MNNICQHGVRLTDYIGCGQCCQITAAWLQEPVPTPTGKKNDQGKPPMALLSGTALIEVAKVLDFGQTKYAAWNWKGGFKWSRLAGAALRHLFAWLSGQDVDDETKLSHLAHCMCCLMFLLDFEVNKIGEDDRYKPVK